MAGTSTAAGVFHEWQTDALATAAQNAQLQGDDVTFAAATPTARIGNRTQISRKEVIVSGTQNAVDKAGRNSELVYQMSKKRDELKRDKEFVLLSNQAPVTGNSSTAPQLRPLCGWITTNVDRGAGGANGTSSAAATDGTQRALDARDGDDGAAERMDAGRQARFPADWAEAARRPHHDHGCGGDQVLRDRRQEDDGHDPGVRG
jgi:hypothetical protein